MPRDPLQNQTTSTGPEDYQGPRVCGLLNLGPEAIGGLPVVRKLLRLDGVGLDVPLRLGGLVLRIAPNVAQEGVVGGGAEENKGVQFPGAHKEEREREMNEGITKVAGEEDVSRARCN